MMTSTKTAELADSQARFGLCTRDPSHGPAEVPWSGERLCWDCADADLDRLAQALESEPVQVGGFGLGNIPHLEPKPAAGLVPGEYDVDAEFLAPHTPTQDGLAEALAADLVKLAGGCLERVDRIMEILQREETWDGVTV